MDPGKTPKEFRKQSGALDSAALSMTKIIEQYKQKVKDSGQVEDYDARLVLFKEHFSKLKFLYLELESKKGFLEDLMNEKTLAQPFEKVIPTLEAQIEETKAQVKETKLSNQALRDDIEEWSKQLLDSHDEFIKEKEVLEDLIDKFAVQSGGEERPSKKLKTEEDPTIVADLEHVKELLGGLDYEVQDAKDEIGRVKEAIATEVENRTLLDREAREQVGEKLMEMHEWYSSAIKLLESLGGVSVKSYLEDGIVLLLQAQWETSVPPVDHQLTVSFEPNTLLIKSAEIAPSDVYIDDIVLSCVGITPFGFLVREVYGRCASWGQIQHEINDAKDIYDISLTSPAMFDTFSRYYSMSVVIPSVDEKPEKLIAVSVPFEYPDSDAILTCVSLKKDGTEVNVPSEELQKCKDQVEEKKTHTLIELVTLAKDFEFQV